MKSREADRRSSSLGPVFTSRGGFSAFLLNEIFLLYQVAGDPSGPMARKRRLEAFPLATGFSRSPLQSDLFGHYFTGTRCTADERRSRLQSFPSERSAHGPRANFLSTPFLFFTLLELLLLFFFYYIFSTKATGLPSFASSE